MTVSPVDAAARAEKVIEATCEASGPATEQSRTMHALAVDVRALASLLAVREAELAQVQAAVSRYIDSHKRRGVIYGVSGSPLERLMTELAAVPDGPVSE